jgi:hypothetical protein
LACDGSTRGIPVRRERLFRHITQNWRGQPLDSRAAVVELISQTTTKTGLKVECAILSCSC